MRKNTQNATSLTPNTTVRLPPDLLAAVDAYRERLAARVPGVKITWGAALRALLVRGLEVEQNSTSPADRAAR